MLSNIFSSVLTQYASFSFSVAISVFIAYVIVDALYARYTIAVADLDEYKAATTGMMTHFLLAFGVITYTKNNLYVIPLVIGSWIGTFYFVRRERLKQVEKNK